MYLVSFRLMKKLPELLIKPMKKLTIRKELPGTITEVWSQFSDKDKLKEWWSPAQFTCPVADIDLRQGGLFHFCFEDADGNRTWGRGKILEVNAPFNFTYLDSFANEKGEAVPPAHYGLPGNEVQETLIEFRFEEDGVNSHMTVVMDDPYDGELTDDLLSGWNQMFNKLHRSLS